MFGIDAYLGRLHAFGAEFAYKQASLDLLLNYQGLSVKGFEKVKAALIGWASI